MSFFQRCLIVLFILNWNVSVFASTNQTLSLEQAEAYALALDPGSQRFQSLSQALRDQAVADAQLPDPQLRLGLMNFPVDTFDRGQEPMTQIQMGVQQMFPRGDSLSLKSQRRLVDAQMNEYQSLLRQRMLQQEVRLKWFELYYWLRAESVVRKNRGLFEQLVEATQYHYGAGRRNQQDVIRAQLELSRIDDRMLDIRTQQDKARAELSVLIHRPAERLILPTTLPDLPTPLSLSMMREQLVLHPLMLVAQSQVTRGQKDVDLAREAYKPGWMLGVTYGLRDGNNPNGSERADFFSVGVTLDLPLFREKRQDRRLSASQHQLGASKLMQDQRLLELRQMLDKNYADWQRLQQRLRLFEDKLIPQSVQNAETTLFAYQNDRSDFPGLVRARIAELDTGLKAIRIDVDRAKAQARVLYFSGDVQ